MYPLRHSPSGLTTLSTFDSRSSKYQYLIALISVFLVITSTIIVCTSVGLIHCYLIDQLQFWNKVFIIAPYLTLTLGVFTFIASFYGFFISSTENRGVLISYATLLSIACVAQFFSISIFASLKKHIDAPVLGIASAKSELEKYGPGQSSTVTHSWDKMQRHLHCCGVTGFEDWSLTHYGRTQNAVPDSCCRNVGSTGCGNPYKDFKTHNQFEGLAQKIYIVGCMEMLQTWMVDYVEPLIDGYYGLGTVIAILEIISIALVSAYAAQINRRRRREALFGMQSKFPGARVQKTFLMPTEEDESEV